MTNDELPDQVTLVISAESVPASELAALISAFDGSFSAFARRRVRRGERPRLAVTAVRHGSIELIFEALQGMQKVVNAGKYISPWATHLADVVKWYLLTAPPPRLDRADRKIVEVVSNTIAKDNATQITLVNHGTVIFNVGPKEASAMQHTLQTGRSEKLVSDSTASAPRLLNDDQLLRLRIGELIGTAFQAAGDWFARLEGGFGVLVPIHQRGGLTVELVDGTAYRFKGSAEIGPRGETVGISLVDADPL